MWILTSVNLNVVYLLETWDNAQHTFSAIKFNLGDLLFHNSHLLYNVVGLNYLRFPYDIFQEENSIKFEFEFLLH